MPIKRKAPSLPARWLAKNGILPPKPGKRALDYGCGYGMDGKTYGMEQYDVGFAQPEGQFDLITCTYVLNTIRCDEERANTILKVQDLLWEDGLAYFAVRRDKRNLTGQNSRGYQCYVSLSGGTHIYENSNFAIYKVNKLCHVVTETKTFPVTQNAKKKFRLTH